MCVNIYSDFYYNFYYCLLGYKGYQTPVYMLGATSQTKYPYVRGHCLPPSVLQRLNDWQDVLWLKLTLFVVFSCELHVSCA